MLVNGRIRQSLTALVSQRTTLRIDTELRANGFLDHDSSVLGVWLSVLQGNCQRSCET